MTTTIINAGSANYMKEIPMLDLPSNCILQKGLTGAGGTTIALENSENYVICVPFKSLIKNKISQVKGVLGVDGNTSNQEINDYISSNLIKKIMVTYDSLPRLINFINPSEYKILIDECHKLIDSGSFRGSAIRGVLDNYKSFKAFTFMTATPVKDAYQHPQLKEIDKVIIKWDNIVPVNVTFKMVESDFNKKIAAVAVAHIEGNKPGNPFFFINSVTSIVSIIKIIKAAGHTDPNLFKIVCADNKDNDEAVAKLGKGFNVSNVMSDNRKITFLTSTTFEGSDIYDENGVTYIITDGKVSTTKYDILTLLPQIIGRLRNSKFKRDVNIIFSPSPYFSHTSEEEYALYIKGQLEEAQGFVEAYNQTSNAMIKKTLLNGAITNAFIIDEDDKLEVNTEAWYNEMHNFESMHTTYYVKKDDNGVRKVSEGHVKNIHSVPYNFIPSSAEEDTLTLLDKMLIEDKVNFIDIAKRYCEEKDSNVSHIGTFTFHIENSSEFKMIAEAYIKLGHDKIKALLYRKGNIEVELLKMNQLKSTESKIVTLLNLKDGEWISSNDAKSKIQDIYDELNVKAKAKGSDLFKWYGVKEVTKKIKGKVIKGFSIITTIVK